MNKTSKTVDALTKAGIVARDYEQPPLSPDARGQVYDVRKGRHAPLVLDEWHRVTRNLEVVVHPRIRSLGIWD